MCVQLHNFFPILVYVFSIYNRFCVYKYIIMLFTQQWYLIPQFVFISWGHAKTRMLASVLLVGLLVSSLWCTIISIQKNFLILLCIMLAIYYIQTFIELDFARYHWELQCVCVAVFPPRSVDLNLCLLSFPDFEGDETNRICKFTE